jgi:hypothetical protein
MVYISIGNACNVKYQISKHKHQSQTLFFDRLMTTMSAVIDIFSCQDINHILFFDNIQRDIHNPFHLHNSRIIVKTLNYCISIHDIKREFTDTDVFEFIDKYKRRFNRMIQIIQSTEQIYFIRTGGVDAYTQRKFIDTILKINPNCNFSLVVIDNDKANDVGSLKYHHCLYLTFNIDNPVAPDWKTDFLNWDTIFKDIEHHILPS